MTSRGRTTPSTPLIGWVFFDCHREDGFTIRWRRGDPVAYVLSGQRVDDQAVTDVLGTIPVLPAGWTDLAEIRSLRRRWVRHREQDTPDLVNSTENKPAERVTNGRLRAAKVISPSCASRGATGSRE
jgi:hypothetical protein